MGIKPNQLAIKALFEQNNTFVVPKYQRGYAWDDEAVTDFIRDIERCVTRRAAGARLNHFFGGVVAVRVEVANSSRSNFEIIDGQQRLASFILLIAALVDEIREVIGEIKKKAKPSKDEAKANTFLENTLESLTQLYLVHRASIELEYVELPKLSMSEADRQFFQALIDEEDEPDGSRASHERLLTAWRLLREFVRAALFASKTPSDSALLVQILVEQVLAEDCTVIYMAADTRSEAYQIFQVLNDRGVQLTDGDMLRARTLELLDDKTLTSIQDKLALAWDDVLAHEPRDIDKFLRWYFASHEGRRPSSSGLDDQFLECRFDIPTAATPTKAGANAILGEVRGMDIEFSLLAEMGAGDWPFVKEKKVLAWDRERLRMLVSYLRHENAMPLLLALHTLGSEKFAEAVASIERFVFRYKTVGNAHVSPMTSVYLRNAKAIRANPTTYKVGSLRSDLRDLVDEKVSLEVFEASLRDMKYSLRTGNTYIRYLLIALEDYRAWYENGANGTPKNKDKTTIFDFSNTTLEHVYPRSATGTGKDSNLEKVKDALGNLAILGPGENNSLANKSFAQKRKTLANSSIKLNRSIGKLAQWTKSDVDARTDTLIKMALKIFVP